MFSPVYSPLFSPLSSTSPVYSLRSSRLSPLDILSAYSSTRSPDPRALPSLFLTFSTHLRSIGMSCSLCRMIDLLSLSSLVSSHDKGFSRSDFFPCVSSLRILSSLDALSLLSFCSAFLSNLLINVIKQNRHFYI